jgi:hypothetical protein
MSFRIKNTHSENTNDTTDKKQLITYTEDEIDLINQQFKNNLSNLTKRIDIKKEEEVEEQLIFDKYTNKWKIVKIIK